MRYLGAHMSIAGGLAKAVERIVAVNGTALQIFSKNQRQWRSAPLSEEQVKAFAAARSAWGEYPVAVHGSYLINLATPKADSATKAVTALAYELRRAEYLDIPYVVIHPGAHLGAGESEGIKAVARRLDEAFALSETNRVAVLLENTAGQGSTLGATFGQIAAMRKATAVRKRVGMCLDTAHAFAAGYDWRSEAGYAGVLKELERSIGLEHLHFMHVNDSKTVLGSRVDRHAHIGAGYIGTEGFAHIMQDERLASIPMVLETPKETDLEDDRRNLQLLRQLAG